MNLNNVSIMGRMTANPERKTTNGGTAVCNFTLAVENGFGENKTTSFIDLVAWKNTAEFVVKYFVKGQLVAVNGYLQSRNWTDKDGNKRKLTEVVATNVFFTGDKKEAAEPVSEPVADGFDVTVDTSDLPF